MQNLDLLPDAAREFLHQVALVLPRVAMAGAIILAGWLIAIPSRKALAFMPPVASFSKIALRVGSARALKISFSIISSHKHALM